MRALGEVRLADRRPEEQLARLEVVDDVHHLQDDAGDPAVADGLDRAGGEQEQVADVDRLGDRRRDPVAELGPQVVDGLPEDDADPPLVPRVVEVEQVQPEEALDLLGVP